MSRPLHVVLEGEAQGRLSHLVCSSGRCVVGRASSCPASDLFRTKHKGQPIAPAPTTEQFAAYQLMFDHFNWDLFGGTLPQVILNFSRDAKRAVGYYAPSRWQNEDKKLDEITLNPEHLQRGAKLTASTLVHEMAHLWQEHHGQPSRTGYHNLQWAAKMEQVGLIPSNTGAPGGKRVGQRMTHYIQPGGVFEKSFERLALALPWNNHGREHRAERKPYEKAKHKYTCPSCRANVWAKPMLRLQCVDCEVRFNEEA